MLSGQIPGTDEKSKALCPRVVGCFTLGLDVQLAVFHNTFLPLSFSERGRGEVYSSFLFRVIFRVVPSIMDSGTTIGVEAIDSAWAASEGVVSGAGSRSSSTVSSMRI